MADGRPAPPSTASRRYPPRPYTPSTGSRHRGAEQEHTERTAKKNKPHPSRLPEQGAAQRGPGSAWHSDATHTAARNAEAAAAAGTQADQRTAAAPNPRRRQHKDIPHGQTPAHRRTGRQHPRPYTTTGRRRTDTSPLPKTGTGTLESGRCWSNVYFQCRSTIK